MEEQKSNRVLCEECYKLEENICDLCNKCQECCKCNNNKDNNDKS